MNIELVRLNVCSFLDIGQNQEVLFKNNNIVGIFGVNKDTGSSNASGKSSFIASIITAIYGPSVLDKTNKELQNRYLDTPASLEIELFVDKKKLIIKRVIGASLSYSYEDSEFISGKSDEVQQQINSLLKLTKEQFLHLSVRQQEERNSFLLMKDSERKDFLSAFFDLANIDNAHEQNKAKLNESESTLLKINNQIEVLNAQLSTISSDLLIKKQRYEIIKSQADTSKSVLTAEILGIKNAVAISVDELTQLDSGIVEVDRRMNEEISQRDNSNVLEIKGLIDLEKQSISALEFDNLSIVSSIDSIKQKINENQYLQKDIDKSLLSIETINSNISKAKDRLCYTCNQHISDEQSDLTKKLETDLHQHNTSIESKIKTIESNKISISYLANFNEAMLKNNECIKLHRDKISQLENNAKNIIIEQSKTLNELKDAKILLQNKKSQIQSTIRTSESTASDKKSQLDQLINLTSSVNGEINSMSESINNLNLTIDQKKELALELNKEVFILNKIDFILSKNGFIGYIFDSILDVLNFEANKNIKDIPLIEDLSIHFTSDKIVKKTGLSNKNIIYKLTHKTEEIRYNSLSGAERTLLILAVDEALDQVVSKRIGVQLGWKIFDEQFMYVDGNNKEYVINFLQSKSKNKTYYIVDHASEFNSSIESKILITKEKGIARITQDDI